VSALTRSQSKLEEVREELAEHKRLCGLEKLDAQSYFVDHAMRLLDLVDQAIVVAKQRQEMDEGKPIEF
jgi:hypothetical protein